MLAHSFISAMLLISSAAAAQTQYGKPGASKGSPQGHSHNCPWFTQGSAERILEGDVIATVTVSDSGEGSCRFSRQSGSHDFLEIFVSRGALPICSAQAMQLKGIGNQAARCKAAGAHNESAEMVSGRVRELSFTVTLASRGQNNPVKSPAPQEDALEQAAEQVAGNLY
jgi:hypothetical protein